MRQMLDFARTSQFDVLPWTTQRNRLFFSPVFQWCFNVNLPCIVVFFLMFCPSILRGAGLGRSMSLNHKNEGWHPLPRDLTANTR